VSLEAAMHISIRIEEIPTGRKGERPFAATGQTLLLNLKQNLIILVGLVQLMQMFIQPDGTAYSFLKSLRIYQGG
jgi:hypothetical protein